MHVDMDCGRQRKSSTVLIRMRKEVRAAGSEIRSRTIHLYPSQGYWSPQMTLSAQPLSTEIDKRDKIWKNRQGSLYLPDPISIPLASEPIHQQMIERISNH